MTDRKYRVVIADDHEEARRLLRKFIALIQPSFVIVAEASDGEELVEKVMVEKPDLVLCDIEMPKLKGVDAIKQCQQLIPNLCYIFTTAHDDFAVEAFKINALDYILKPIQKDRLFQALEKAKVCVQNQARILDTPKQMNKKIPIKFNRSLFYVIIEDILFIEKEGRKAILHTKNHTYPSIDSLEELKTLLPENFVQSHRSFIINLNHVSYIQTMGKSYMVYFYDYEKPAQISKQHITSIQKQIEDYYQ
ncbi:LytR/AlgR family response regulator transcription factor [Paraliobacillus sediminis]|uniref:LytR/AlgR family response regulator transcription factor n=1 Tax=Paraliobacillus sediminis TaxID=1885916 RepID=UPI000E3C5209|nr:LytTR family DNA-binding domain-containing protein [Paraliobacillus sediminis]